MSQPRFPLRINVGFLINQPIGSSRDIHFEFPQIRLTPDFDLQDFAGVVRISRTPQGLLMQADFKASVPAECVRCLAEFIQPLHTEYSELYAFSANAVTESNLMVPEDGNIDLGPMTREYLLLEVPISPLCKPDCKGLCLICGEDLNTTPCEHMREQQHASGGS